MDVHVSTLEQFKTKKKDKRRNMFVPLLNQLLMSYDKCELLKLK